MSRFLLLRRCDEVRESDSECAFSLWNMGSVGSVWEVPGMRIGYFAGIVWA